MPTTSHLSVSDIGEELTVNSTNSSSPLKIHDVTDNKTARVSISARNLHSATVDVYLRVKNGTTTGDYQKYTLAAQDTQKKEEFIWIDKIVGNASDTGVDIEAYASVVDVVQLTGIVITSD